MLDIRVVVYGSSLFHHFMSVLFSFLTVPSTFLPAIVRSSTGTLPTLSLPMQLLSPSSLSSTGTRTMTLSSPGLTSVVGKATTSCPSSCPRDWTSDSTLRQWRSTTAPTVSGWVGGGAPHCPQCPSRHCGVV